MNMPKLRPILIKTKNQTLFKRVRAWLMPRTWEVVEDWEFEMPDGRRIVIPKGFEFDGASIPRPLWAMLSPTGLLLIPGLIHDFGYRFDYVWRKDENGTCCRDRRHTGRKYWDKLFFEIGEHVNGMKVINPLAWVALFFFGRAAWNKNREKDEGHILPRTCADNAALCQLA